MSIDLTLTTFTVVEGPDNGVVRVIAGSVRYETMTFASENLPGPQGPQGAQGSQGPQGAQGAQGPAGASGSILYAAAFGVLANGTHDDTVAMQAAIDAYLATRTAYTELQWPPGRIRLTAGLNIPLCEGWRIRGAGTGDGFNVNGNASIYRGTVLVWDGGPGVVLNIDGCSDFVLEDFLVTGSNGEMIRDSEVKGIRLQHRNGFGSGSGVIRAKCSFLGVGIDIGSIDEGDTDHVPGNGDTSTLNECVFVNCDSGIRLNDDQNVVFQMNRPGFAQCDVCIDCPKGGLFTALSPNTYDCGRFLRIGNGGVSMCNEVIGLKLDGSVRTIIYEAIGQFDDDGNFLGDGSGCETTFFDPVANPAQLAQTAEPRFKLRKNHAVRVIGGGSNLAGPNESNVGSGKLFELTTGGTFHGIGVKLPASGSDVDQSKVVGAVNGGSWKLRDSRSHTWDSDTFLNDASGAFASP